jgi:hypothetical protein
MRLYAILRGKSTLELEQKVEDYLERGYVCQGGLVIGGDQRYYQAMVRE